MKGKIIFIGILLMVLLVVNVEGTTSNDPNDYIGLDFFNRADSGTSGSPDVGGAWVDGVNAHTGIRTNMLNQTGTRAVADDTDFSYTNYTNPDTIRSSMVTWNVSSTAITSFFMLNNGLNKRCQWRPILGDFIFLHGGGTTDTLENYVVNVQYNLSISYNDTSGNCLFLLNSSSINYTSGWVADHGSGTIESIGVGGANGGTSNFEDLRVWNGTIDDLPQASPIPDTLNLSASTPANFYQTDINLMDFNLTANASSVFDCRFYVNGTLNQSDNFLNGTNIPIGFSETFPTGSYSYNISCNTTTTNESTTTNNFYVDSVDPTIVEVDNPNNMVFFLTNLTGRFNLTDNFYLHRINASIDGIQIQTIAELNTTLYDYNLSYYVGNLTSGNHELNLTLSDGHTSHELSGDYEVSTGWWDRYLKYEFYDGGNVEITGLPDSIFDEFTTEKQTDRYTFTYEPSNIQNNYSFEVKSDMPIYIVNRPNSKYQKWLIVGESKWLDFYMENEPNMNVDITRINNNEVRVHVSNLQFPELQQYSSIGDLNIITQSYTFAVANASMTYSSVVNEYESQTNTLIINTTSPLITGTQAGLFWNNTQYSVTKTSLATYDQYTTTFVTPSISSSNATINITWDYNISTALNTESGNVTNNQTIYRIGIDNCSIYTTHAVNMTIKNESDDHLVEGTIDGHFRAWISDIGQYRSFNLSWGGSNNYSICIDPNDATYQVYAQMEYEAPTFNTKTYYFTNTTLNNETDLLDLFLTHNTTQVSLEVTDQNDNPLGDIYISILSYQIPTDSYTTTEIVKSSDVDGKAYAQMLLNDQWYRFILTYNGEIVLETQETKLTSTTYKFRVNLVEDYFENYDIVHGVSCSINYTTATNNFRLTFNDPTGNVVNATLNIKEIQPFTEEIVNSSSLISSSGTILLQIPSIQNSTYLATGLISFDGNSYACGNPYSINPDQEFVVWGDEGVFLTSLLAIALIMIGVWNPIVGVILMMVASVVTIIMGSFYMSLPILIGFLIWGVITIYKLNK